MMCQLFEKRKKRALHRVWTRTFTYTNPKEIRELRKENETTVEKAKESR